MSTNSTQSINRPPSATDERLEFLDYLRESGVTNMFGGGAYLREEYGIGRAESSEVLGYWMKTFSDRHPAKRSTP